MLRGQQLQSRPLILLKLAYKSRQKREKYKLIQIENYQSKILSHFEDVEEQNGFHGGRFCIDIFKLKQFLEKRIARNVETRLVLTDFKKAYDSVPLNKPWPVLLKIGFGTVYIRAVEV